MTQEERWLAKYNEVVEFIENNHRNPSRYRIEEHDMLNWVKANRKNECRENTRTKIEYVQGTAGAYHPCQGTGP